jgi:hypothetical protein
MKKAHAIYLPNGNTSIVTLTCSADKKGRVTASAYSNSIEVGDAVNTDSGWMIVETLDKSDLLKRKRVHVERKDEDGNILPGYRHDHPVTATVKDAHRKFSGPKVPEGFDWSGFEKNNHRSIL